MTKFQIDSYEWAGLSKIVEETSELNTIIAKLMATNGRIIYWDGTNLCACLEDEMADVLATLIYSIKENGLDLDLILERAEKKVKTYNRWRDGEDKLLDD